jgi:GT2 family glycosyltransferase
MNIEDTKACVSSIQEKCQSPYSIIVDNGSSNHTGNELKEIYADQDTIQVITTDNNLGFAQGMNIGYNEAKKKGAEFICLVNSDIEILTNNFDSEITRLHKETSFAVCGPDIHTLSKRRQNPAGFAFDNLKELERIIFQHSMYYYLSFLNLDKLLPKWKKKLFGKSENQKFRESHSRKSNTSQINVKLHGAFLICAPEYINLYKGLNPNTFLYGEEDILYYELRKKNLKTLYSVDLQVLHKEDGSLNSVIKSKSRKRRFIYKHQVNSYKIFKELIIKDNNKHVSLSNM